MSTHLFGINILNTPRVPGHRCKTPGTSQVLSLETNPDPPIPAFFIFFTFFRFEIFLSFPRILRVRQKRKSLLFWGDPCSLFCCQKARVGGSGQGEQTCKARNELFDPPPLRVEESPTPPGSLRAQKVHLCALSFGLTAKR